MTDNDAYIWDSEHWEIRLWPLDNREGLWQLGWRPMSGSPSDELARKLTSVITTQSCSLKMLDEVRRENGCGELILRLPEHSTQLSRLCSGVLILRAHEEPLLPQPLPNPGSRTQL